MGQSQVNLRVDEDLRERADSIFDNLGLSMSSAFTMFLRAVVRQRGISFLPLDLSVEEATQQDVSKETGVSSLSSWGYDDYVSELEKRVLSLPVDSSIVVSVHTIFDQDDEQKDIGRKRIGGSLGRHIYNNQEQLGLRYIPDSVNPALYHKVQVI